MDGPTTNDGEPWVHRRGEANRWGICMFEWLEQEISAIRTPRFHVVDGPADAKLREAVIGSGFFTPPAYREFVLKFGNAKLYRNARNNSYRVGVFAAPREGVSNDGARIYHIGFHDGARVYVKFPSDSAHSPIYEFESGSEAEVANSFEEWLSASCIAARNAYGKAEWAEIPRGPKPFTAKEMEIIEARRSMRWRVLGIDADGNHIFEVMNAGRRVLATLTVGVRSKDRRLNGAIGLSVRSVSPGQTVLLHASCYKDLLPPQDVEVFPLPDPKPEDRGYYWEFKETM